MDRNDPEEGHSDKNDYINMENSPRQSKSAQIALQNEIQSSAPLPQANYSLANNDALNAQFTSIDRGVDAIADEVVFLACGHNFHKKCIESHLKVSNKCPICRGEVQTPTYETFEPMFLSY